MILALLLAACTPDDTCDAMCVSARDRYAGCLEEVGLSWGPAVGYTSATDYDDWCATYTWELRELGEEASCAERLPVFEAGTCNDYYDAWDDE